MRGRWVWSAVVAATFGCKNDPEPPAAPPATPGEAHAGLVAQSSEFERQVLTVTEGVHVAIGYGLANSIWLEGTDGVVVVDTLGSMTTANAAVAELRKLTDKPVRAVILTHNHADHIFGTEAFIGADSDVPVYAHAKTDAAIDRVVSVVRPIIYKRSMRMFGTHLSQADQIGCGIGGFLDNDLSSIGLVRPTHTVDEALDLDIAGLKIRLVHAPGETDDQLFVWLPDKKVLLPADNFYRSFPNLYTIRGTPYRDVRQWVQSLDAMRALEPEFLVPSHTRPVLGKAAIAEALTDYRDAIQIVHDQTVRGMNQGLDPDALARFVQLPPHLAKSPFLAEHYGTVEWSVRSIFDGYLGWFDGNPVHLHPLDRRERAERWAATLPQGTTLVSLAQDALTKGDAQWAAELGDLALALDPEDAKAKAVLSNALRARGIGHVSANGRNFYLTRAEEIAGRVEIAKPSMETISPSMLAALPAENFLRAMPVHLKAEDARDVDLVAAFHFTDVNKTFAIHVRRGVAVFSTQAPSNPAFTITTTGEVWKKVVVRQLGPARAVAEGKLDLSGDVIDLVRFLGLFERP